MYQEKFKTSMIINVYIYKHATYPVRNFQAFGTETLLLCKTSDTRYNRATLVGMGVSLIIRVLHIISTI